MAFFGDSPSWAEESNLASAEFGASVAFVGDTNGDGFDDIVVGAPGWDDAFSDEGSALLYFGGPFGPTWSGWAVKGGQAGAKLGAAVSGAGDVNGDGYHDIIVGAPLYDAPAPDAGKVFVYFGGPGGPSFTADWTTSPAPAFQSFGHAVAGVGDVNGDGFDDVVVGAPQWEDSAGLVDEGAALLYYGSASGPQWSGSLFKGGQAFAEMGTSVAGAGDVNGDGYDDIIAGAPKWDDLGLLAFDAGRVWVFFGSSSGPSSSNTWETAPATGGRHFGHSVSSAGDVNGDGYDDIVVGAPKWDGSFSDEGAALFYYGSASGPQWSNRLVTGGQLGAELGSAVASLGDVDQDGFDDIAVGAPKFDAAIVDEGRVFVYPGSAGGVATAPIWIGDGPDQNLARYGAALTGGGSLNGSPFGQLFVGSPGFGVAQFSEGRAYGYEVPPPLCSVVPAALEFGDVEVDSAATASFIIRNDGGMILAGTPSLESIDFAIISGGTPFALGPGEFQEVTVEFHPTLPGVSTCSVSSGCGETVTGTGSGVLGPASNQCDGAVLFEQSPSPTEGGWGSTNNSEDLGCVAWAGGPWPFYVETADDFTLPQDAVLTRVGWRGTHLFDQYGVGSPFPPFRVAIYLPEPFPHECPQGLPIFEAVIPPSQTNQTFDDADAAWRYCATLPSAFMALAGTKYLLSVQAQYCQTPLTNGPWYWRKGVGNGVGLCWLDSDVGTYWWSIDGVECSFGLYGEALWTDGRTLVDHCDSSSSDGIWNPGEQAELTISLAALGRDYEAITGILSTATPGVNVIQASSNWPDIPAGTSGVNSVPFVVELDPDVECASAIEFTLVVDTGIGHTFDISLDERAGEWASATDTPLPIPDDTASGVVSTMVVGGAGIVSGLTPHVEIMHPRIGDLKIVLESPAGTTVTLLDRPGFPAWGSGCPDQNMSVVFDDNANVDLEDYCGTFADPWYVGVGRPVEPLSAFDGQSLAGTWRLNVADLGLNNPGNLVSWGFVECDTCGAGSASGVGPEIEGGSRFSIRSLDNPAGATINFAVTLPIPGDTAIDLFDVKGRCIRVLDAGKRPAGRFEIAWDAQNNRGVRVASGVYLARLTLDGRERARAKIHVLAR